MQLFNGDRHIVALIWSVTVLLLEVLMTIDSTVMMIALMIMRAGAMHNAINISCGRISVASFILFE